MEIKLNQYTLPLLCGLVSSVTYAIIRYTIQPKTQNFKEKKGQNNSMKDESEEGDTDSSETEYMIQKSLTRKDSIDAIYLAKHKRKISESQDEIECNNDPYDKKIKEDTLTESTKYEEYDCDESEENNPAQMLHERIERSKLNSSGTGARRGTIAFADELQATLADHFKHSDSSVDKSGCNAILNKDGIDKNETNMISAEPASDIKPILKQQFSKYFYHY